MTYIHCPECDAIITLDAPACPECGCCAYCGHKIDKGMQSCECGFPEDEKLVARVKKHHGIPDDALEQERAKLQRRKKLEPYKLAVRIIGLGFCFFLGVITTMALLAKSNELIQVVLGVPVVCILVFLYWIAAQGIAKILIWIAKKIGIGD
jgi:hypothetical protein